MGQNWANFLKKGGANVIGATARPRAGGIKRKKKKGRGKTGRSPYNRKMY